MGLVGVDLILPFISMISVKSEMLRYKKKMRNFVHIELTFMATRTSFGPDKQH